MPPADAKSRASAQLELPFFSRRREALSHARTLLAGRPVSYTVKRSRRRRAITFTIDEQGLRVGAPWRASEQAIEKLLREHCAWVLGKLAEWEARRPPPRCWRDGETLMLLGEPLRLTCMPSARPIEKTGGQLLVGAPGRPDTGAIAAGITSWFRDEALACFRARVAHYHPVLGVPVPEIRLSNARTRWGSCHAGGRVLLNWRLIQMPLRLVDYVVVHELAHLREMNHSPRFWSIVARVIPDHAARRAEIRAAGHHYLLV